MGWLQILTGLDNDVVDYPFSRGDIARYHTLVTRPEECGVDVQTARDMLLDDYADALGRDTSIFGRQMLHRRLHGDGKLEPARVRSLLAAPEMLARLGAICRPLRAAETEIAQHLFGDPLPPPPRWVRWLWVLPLAWLASIALAFVVPLGWVTAVALTMALVAIQTAWHERAQEWDRVLLPLRTMLDVHRALGSEPAMAELAPFAADAASAGQLRRRFELALGDRVPGQREYRDWLLQANVKRYFGTRAALMTHRDFLRQSFALVAALEADCALARHLQGIDTFCWAETGVALTLRGVLHPLLARPAPVDFAPGRGGAFISGQNGVGKSTLLRTVGINLIAARAFGFCYATAAQVPSAPVYASMQSEDAMDSGESLYMAELRRARELLALAAAGPAVFIIDEIFRGTNHLESVAAAAAVLHELARHHLVIVSSHNLELAPLLRTRLAPFCVAAIDGAVCVRPGVLAETNGIRLLAGSGFDPAIQRDANTVFAWLSKHARGEDAGPPPVLH